MKYLSLLFILCFSFCAVKQNLTDSNKLTEGMTQAEVKAIMGDPVKSDFNKNLEEWHYCMTRATIYEYISLFFYEKKLIAKKNYSVLPDEENGICGSCEYFIKMGNYVEPINVTEIRIR